MTVFDIVGDDMTVCDIVCDDMTVCDIVCDDMTVCDIVGDDMTVHDMEWGNLCDDKVNTRSLLSNDQCTISVKSVLGSRKMYKPVCLIKSWAIMLLILGFLVNIMIEVVSVIQIETGSVVWLVEAVGFCHLVGGDVGIVFNFNNSVGSFCINYIYNILALMRFNIFISVCEDVKWDVFENLKYIFTLTSQVVHYVKSSSFIEIFLLTILEICKFCVALGSRLTRCLVVSVTSRFKNTLYSRLVECSGRRLD